MSQKSPRIPTPRSHTSAVPMEQTESCSSRDSDSPIHWETLMNSDLPEPPKVKPSSWDNSDDELPLALERNIPGGHIYSSDMPSNRKSVATEINELKKQFFQAVVTETGTDIEDLREKLETSLRNDRRKSPARMRRRTKSSSSSSTVMDVTVQGSPRRGEEFNPLYEAIFDNTENTAPVLELDSRFYLDNFFAELRRKRISLLESTVEIANERNEEDFQEVALEDPDEFVNLSNCGYYKRSSRKLSQILEVEENKKDSDKDGEECIENTEFFLKFLRKSENSDCSPLHTARSVKNEKLFKNSQEEKYKFQPSIAEVRNPKNSKDRRNPTDIASELCDEIISLTAKTGSIQLNSPKKKEMKKNNDDLHGLNDDDDINWSLIENLKLDLMKTSENPTPRKSSRLESNSGSGSRRSTKDGSLQSPKFTINLGKESARSLKLEDVKTPNSVGKNSVNRSERSKKDHQNNSQSALRESNSILLDLKSPSLASHTSNQSSESQHILRDQRMNTSLYSQITNYANETRDEEEISIGSELPYRSNRSESSPRSLNSRSSRSSRSNRISSRAPESRKSSQRSEKLENLEPLIRTSRRSSSSSSPRAELELLKLASSARSEKSRSNSSRNKESPKSTPQGIRTATSRTSKSFIENIHSESKSCCESFNNSECIPNLVNSDWMDAENIQAIFSNREESQLSPRSEIIISEISESLLKATHNDYIEEQRKSRNSSRKSVITENSDNLDDISSTRSTKDKSRLNSYGSEERALLNIPLNTERSDEVKLSQRTIDRSEILEECEKTPIQTLTNDSESDRRLSIINEVSSEDMEFRNVEENSRKPKQSSPTRSEESDRGTSKSHPASHRSVNDKKNDSIIKPEPEVLWNDLIETFNTDQNHPFNWQDTFLGFLNTNQNTAISSEKGTSSQVVENTKFFKRECSKNEDDDYLVLKGLTESIRRSSPKNEDVLHSAKPIKKNEDFLENPDVDMENNLSKKMKGANDTENLYYFEVENAGNYGIGEFGDVTCWNLGMHHTPEEGKPKGDGDGTLSPYHKENLASNQENNKIQERLWTNLNDVENSMSKVHKSFPINDDLDLMSFYRNDFKRSKSDNSIKTTEFNQSAAIDFLIKKNNNSNTEQRPLVCDTFEKRKRRAAASSISSKQCSSSEWLSDETDNQDFDFESVRKTASLTNIIGKLHKSGYEKLESNEELYNSRSRLFEKVGKEIQNKDATNLNIFLARKKEEDTKDTKANWLILKQSREKTCPRENKKFKSRLKIDKSLIRKDSKEYLSFKSRPSVPALKLKDSNCFQNFYKRVISVFCLTSNSSLPTSK